MHDKANDAVDKLRAPVSVNGTDRICSVDPSLPEVHLETGARVLLNKAFAATDSLVLDKNGPVPVGTETCSSAAVAQSEELIRRPKSQKAL